MTARSHSLAPDRLRRWLYATCGVACVGIGAVGVFVPGLPTTIFLIAASWLFTRSCPWLENRLIRNRLFRPYMEYMNGHTPMSTRARISAMGLMWFFILVSCLALDSPEIVILAGIVGTYAIATYGCRCRADRATASPQYVRASLASAGPCEPPRLG